MFSDFLAFAGTLDEIDWRNMRRTCKRTMRHHPELSTMTLVESLLHALRGRWPPDFGIPGDFAFAIFRIAGPPASCSIHTLSHEPLARFAADAAARLQGGIGIMAVTYGAGALKYRQSIRWHRRTRKNRPSW